MKRPRFRTAAILALALSSASSLAQTVAHEPFAYNPAVILDGQNGGTGFAEPWFESDAYEGEFDDIRTGSLRFNFLASSGNSLRSQAPTSFSTTLTRGLAQPVAGTAGTTMWVSFLMRKDSEGTSTAPENYFGLVLYTANESAPALFVGDTSETDLYSIATAGSAAGQFASTVQSTVSPTPTLVVVKITFANGPESIELFVNPDPSAGTPTTAAASKADLDLPNISAVGILAGLDATWTADEIRLGSTFKDVAPTPGRFANISTRMRVETGDNVLIGGFIIQGDAAKKVIVRALGPSLPPNVPSRLQDPTLELYGPNGLVAENNNWRTTQEQEIRDTGIPPADDREAAIVATLPAGAYTALVRGLDSTTGVGLVEVYDIQPQPNTALVNIATRGFVQRGDDVMIGGLIVAGDTPRRVIVRGIGPSLQQSGVSNALQDPVLQLFDGNGVLIGENNDWRSNQEQEIIATTIPPSDNREAAIVAEFRPGNYTAVLYGNGDTIGVGSVEAYQLQ